MNTVSWLLWGFAATLVLTVTLAGSQALGLTRINLPYLLGTLVVPQRDKAKLWGVLVHLLNGWLFSLLYVAAFHAWGGATVWRGMAVGLVHALFVLGAGMPALPGLHPRMASDDQGPEPTPLLEPPGPFATNYGPQTPISLVLAHLLFGAILGAFYRL